MLKLWSKKGCFKGGGSFLVRVESNAEGSWGRKRRAFAFRKGSILEFVRVRKTDLSFLKAVCCF